MAPSSANLKKLNLAIHQPRSKERPTDRILKFRLKKMLSLQQEGKACYEEADEILEDLREHLNEGEIIKIGHKQYALRNNFQDSNVAFRAAAIRQYEICEVKPKAESKAGKRGS